MECRLPCPSPIPGAYSNSCPSSWWCHPTISSSVVHFSSCLQSFPAAGSFPMSQFFTSVKTKLKGLLWEFDELMFMKLCYQFSSAMLLLLLLLSRFSHVRPYATPETAAHQAPTSLGFSRQEPWSGLPFSSPVHESEKWKVKVKSLSCVWLFATLWTAAYQAPLSMGFSRQERRSGVPVPSPSSAIVAFVTIGNSCTPLADSCQCMAKPIQYCKVK